MQIYAEIRPSDKKHIERDRGVFVFQCQAEFLCILLNSRQTNRELKAVETIKEILSPYNMIAIEEAKERERNSCFKQANTLRYLGLWVKKQSTCRTVRENSQKCQKPIA
jgi:hypothetical protein